MAKRTTIPPAKRPAMIPPSTPRQSTLPPTIEHQIALLEAATDEADQAERFRECMRTVIQTLEHAQRQLRIIATAVNTKMLLKRF